MGFEPIAFDLLKIDGLPVAYGAVKNCFIYSASVNYQKCGREDSNLHALRHSYLKAAWLPLHHFRITV